MTDSNRNLEAFLRGADECLPHHDAVPELEAAERAVSRGLIEQGETVEATIANYERLHVGWDANGSPVE